jgi:flagellar basal-body rod protein FlgB
MIDQVFAGQNYELAKRLLDAAALRHEALATNLANIETPGFKRLDLAPDFARQLENYSTLSIGRIPESLQPKIAEDLTARAVRPDGNNVQLDHELLEMNRDSLEYDLLTQFASDSLKRLKVAVTGRTM